MSTQTISLENFEEIYDNTYNQVLKNIVCKCSNIDDVNDLIQDTYAELYKTLQRKTQLTLENPAAYVKGIAKKQIGKYYGLLYKYKANSEIDFDTETTDIPSDIDIEANIIQKLNAEEVWKYVREKKSIYVKVFFLYFVSDMKISQIADELNLTETNTKAILYRTIKDIKNNVKIEGDIDV